jgi:muramidase (phage lysozyme)
MTFRRDDLQQALQHPNVRAFLRAIRLGEGTSDDDGYRRIVGDGGLFGSFDDHPRKPVWIPRYKVWSSAAGAYQIIRRTWDGLVSQYRFTDFSPESQDEAAVALIIEKGALDDAIAGNIAEAVRKCAPVWASLPGSKAGQRTEHLYNVVAEYEKHGGVVA